MKSMHVFAIPRYTTFEYPICFFTMRNRCSTLQRTADFSCSIFLSQLRPLKSSAILRLDGTLIYPELNLGFLLIFLNSKLVDSSKISGIAIYNLIIFSDEICRFCDIMHICRCAGYCMNIPTACINTGMYLHSEVPFIALLCLMHFRITFALLILSGFWCCYKAGINNSAPCIIRPALSRRLLTSAKSFSPSLFDSSICLNSLTFYHRYHSVSINTLLTG